jgi:hypothetical protein
MQPPINNFDLTSQNIPNENVATILEIPKVSEEKEELPDKPEQPEEIKNIEITKETSDEPPTSSDTKKITI